MNKKPHTTLKQDLSDIGMHIEAEEFAVDVVCGMELDTSSTALHAEYCDEVYYFCSKTCRYHFVKNPEMYIG